MAPGRRRRQWGGGGDRGGAGNADDELFFADFRRLYLHVNRPTIRSAHHIARELAMQRGVPVAAASVSSLPEVGGDAARWFDPYDEDDIAAALIDVLTNEELRRRLSEAGRSRAALFSWRRTAELTLESWDRAAASFRG